MTALEKLAVDTIRTLSMDAVQKANSGHPGAPMGMAPVAYTLWQRRLRYDPADPGWPNRDRFVLSAGHASMLLYSLLYLADVKAAESTGVPAVSFEDIESFRQLGSRCPGHPESHLTPGVETTTGPLGQGAANAAGMALAGRWLAARFNRPDFELFDFDVWALLGDGCLMEGVSAEAASLAGHLGLSNLCWIYDSNAITIEGSTDLAFTEDVARRFEAYRWRVEQVEDANDLETLDGAFGAFKAEEHKPTLIIVKSHIAWGSPNKQDSHGAHGSPLGEEEIRLTKRAYGWPEDKQFNVPDGVREHFADGLGERGSALRVGWLSRLEEYRSRYPQEAGLLDRLLAHELPDDWEAALPTFPADAKGLATRASSGKVLQAVAERVPWLMGGSADLAPSNKTFLSFEDAGTCSASNPGGRNLHFGVREHAMAAIVNGLALSGLRPYGASFLVFTDYARPAIRLSAMMGLGVIWIFTHDSISVGEDGPTHQPVEHLASLRAIPGLVVIRPADANEVVEAWRLIMGMDHEPALLCLSRQALPTIDRTKHAPASGLARGAYVLADSPKGRPDVLLLGSGSEVSLCLEAQRQLATRGIAARVVSMPSWELFERQDKAYRDVVLPPDVRARVSVEQASTFGWERYVGLDGTAIGMTSFGASAPAGALLEHFGFTVDAVVAAARRQVREQGS